MKILFAVSGGIDSMCMADRFCQAQNGDAIAHCNFHLRGEESDADSLLVQEWAEVRGLRFFRADFDTEEYARQKGISIEMAARELRYSWFAQTALREGFDAVAVAHNANDNAETLLLNLLRGTGGRGLRGMNADGFIPGTDVRLLRPLLGTSREEIEDYCHKHKVPFREDRTNAETIYKRNKLRHEVLPVFKEINPSYLQTLARDMEHIAQENDIAEDYWQSVKGQVLNGQRLNVPALLGLKHWKYALFRAIEQYGLSRQGADSLLALLESLKDGSCQTFAGKSFLSPTHRLTTGADSIVIESLEGRDEGNETIVNAPGEYHFNGRTVLIELVDCLSDEQLRGATGVLSCNIDALPFPLTLRKWESGDWMRPFGMGGRKKKLSDIFTDLKLSIPEKEASIVLHSASLDAEDNGHVAALVGLRMDEALRIPKGFTGKYLKISLI